MMHLGMILLGAGGHVAGWRLPGAEWGSENVPLLRRIAATAERGRFDFLFLADAVNTRLDAHPGMMVRLEPLTLLGALSMVTERIGLGATVSTTYSEPYNVARMLASIDHLSNGRAAWNVVTGSSPDAAANFSRDKHPPHAERYARAAEFLALVEKLWDSWGDGAIVGDKQTGRFADPALLHVPDHKGTFFQVKGPLNISRPPQGHPVIMQAGASDAGRDFAAATAEVVFTAQGDLDEARAFALDMRARCVKAGRPANALRILPGINPVVGRTEAEAKDKIARLGALVDPVAALRVLSDRLGHDLSAYDLDAAVPDLPPSGMMQGHAVQLARRRMTLRELRDYTAVSSGHRVLYGTAETIADDMETWHRAGAADGFVIQVTHHLGPLDQFIDEVVPILVRRGLFRADYQGATLRDHLGLQRPRWPLAASGTDDPDV